MEVNSFYRDRLKQELTLRCERNPRYSVRAFARALNIDAGTLSKLLAGKQIPSYRMSERLIHGLALAGVDQERFISSIVECQKSRQLQRLSPQLRSHSYAPKHSELSLEMYRVISDWYHFAILELTYLPDFQAQPRWIARQLGIGVLDAKLALERLFHLNLLKKQGRRVVKTSEQLFSIDKHLTTAAHKKNQKQFLNKAVDSLENDPIEERNMTSMTMAIDPRKMPIAKKMIQEFNRALCLYLESGARARVYNLEIALYPIQKKTVQKGKNK